MKRQTMHTQPRAVRYLWHNSPCAANEPFSCPVYAPAPTLGALSGERTSLPLAPFILPLP